MFMKKAEVGDQGAKRGVYRQDGIRGRTPRAHRNGRSFELKFGRVEARIKVPKGKGNLARILVAGAPTQSGCWPACGEIDIMENVGSEPTKVTAACTAWVPGSNPNWAHVHAAQPSSIQRRLSCFCDRVGAADSALLRGRCSLRDADADKLPRVRSGHSTIRFSWCWILPSADTGRAIRTHTPFPETMLVDYVRVYRLGDERAEKGKP